MMGAGRGIGKGLAQGLAAAGADVVLNALTPRSVEQTAAETAKDTGCRVMPLLADVTKAENVQVNAIAPGIFPDPVTAGEAGARRTAERAAQMVPLGRPGKLQEVGLLALYLASCSSSEHASPACSITYAGASGGTEDHHGWGGGYSAMQRAGMAVRGDVVVTLPQQSRCF